MACGRERRSEGVGVSFEVVGDVDQQLLPFAGDRGCPPSDVLYRQSEIANEQFEKSVGVAGGLASDVLSPVCCGAAHPWRAGADTPHGVVYRGRLFGEVRLEVIEGLAAF